MSEMTARYPTFPTQHRVFSPMLDDYVIVVMDVSTEDFDVLEVHLKLKGGDWASAELEERENPYAAVSRLINLVGKDLLLTERGDDSARAELMAQAA